MPRRQDAEAPHRGGVRRSWRRCSISTPEALSDARVQGLRAVMRQYVDVTGKDEMLHRNVVRAVNGLVEYLQSERKRVPNEILIEAERLACLLLLGYDPYFEGDE